MRRHLPILDERILDDIRIATPCEEAWEEMRGDDRVRHCAGCKQDVYNISSLTRAEAVRLVTRRKGRACVRLFRRPDGTVLTEDCWERLRAARRRGVFALAAAILLVGFAQIALRVTGVRLFIGALGEDRESAGATHATTGLMLVPPPPTFEVAGPGVNRPPTLLGRLQLPEQGAPQPSPAVKTTAKPATPKTLFPKARPIRMGKVSAQVVMGEYSVD